MPYYRIIFHSGDPKPAPGLESGEPISGFYTTRIVEALDETQAINAGKSSVSNEWFRMGWGNFSGSLEVDTVKKIGVLSGLFGRPRRGFTFYRDG